MRSIFSKYFPVAILLTLVIVIGIINFVPGTMLTGWDNLHPEFNFWLNIKRSIFAVWQEYQGLGLLGGMGHASDLVRQMFLAIIGSFVSHNLLRFLWMMLTLFLGSTGTYIFTRTLLVPYQNRKREIYSLLGGVFYLLNLATMQTFYAPFEAFTSHYAFLPWLLWATLEYIRQGNKKALSILFVIGLLSTPAAYIPTLFVSFLLGLSVVVGGVMIFSQNRRHIAINSIKAYGILFVVNAFWLLPFLYFTITSSSVSLSAKMNQMATHTIFSQNKEFGTLQDVALLKGFWFNNVDPDLSGNFNYMLAPWRHHLNNPFIVAAGLILFGIILMGTVNVLRKRRPLHIGVLLLFIFSITMLAVDTVPFAWIVSFLRQIPLFGEAFRFPFTKFSILAAFSYSLLFTLGIEFLNEMKNKILTKITIPIVELLAIFLIGCVTLPVFTGNLFYQKEQLKMPLEYKDTFDFFKNQDQNARIANFPQQTFWGWNFYTWGYGGSGFLWYGIKQPILDRAFDVWSAPLENYYNEVSYAVYSKNPELLEQVLNKYQVSFILVDKNIYSPSSPTSLFYHETDTLLSQIPSVSKAAQFGKIEIYKVNLRTKMDNYLFTTPMLPKSNGYTWGDKDNAYQRIGSYINSADTTVYYPFASFFSNKLYKKDYLIKESSSEIVITKKLPNISDGTLILPALLIEKLIPIEIYSEKDSQGITTLKAQILVPTIILGSNEIKNKITPIKLITINNPQKEYIVTVNGTKSITFNPSSNQRISTYLKLDADNYISFQDSITGELNILTVGKDTIDTYIALRQRELELKNIKQGTTFSIHIPKVIDSYYSFNYQGMDFKSIRDCNTFRNGSIRTNFEKNSLIVDVINDSVCTSISSSLLSHDQGYLIHLNNKNIKGDSPHLWVLNDNEGYAPIDIDLESRSSTSQFFILPPMDKGGFSYSFHVDSTSIGREEAINDITGLSVVSIPFNYLTNISISTGYKETGKPFTFTSTHPNESLYTVQPQKGVNQLSTIILSQSYDMGWQAYVGKKTFWASIFPFFSGKSLQHVKVNNWENGWIVDPASLSENSQIIIVYLPQYLEYAGFLGLILLLAVILFKHFFNGVIPRFVEINTFFDKRAQFFKELILLRMNSSRS